MNRTNGTRCPTRNDVTYTRIVVSSLIIIVVSFVINCYISYVEKQTFVEVKKWMMESKLEEFTDTFEKNGITSLQKVSQLSKIDIALLLKQSWLTKLPKKTIADVDRITKQTQNLKKNLQFKYWLNVNKLKEIEEEFYKHNIWTLQDVLNSASMLKSTPEFLGAYPAFIILEADVDIGTYPVAEKNNYILSFLYYLWTWLVTAAKLILIGTLLITVIIGILIRELFSTLIQQIISKLFRTGQNTRTQNRYGNNQGRRNQPNPHNVGNTHAGLSPFLQFMSGLFLNSSNNRHNNTNNRQNHGYNSPNGQNNPGWFNSLIGNYFDAEKCKVTWNISDDNAIVGNEVIITVQFFCHNGLSYNADSLRSVKSEVIGNQTMIESVMEYSESKESITVHFTPIKAGSYKISILADGELVGACPYEKIFCAGEVDPFKSSLVVPSSLLVLQEGHQELLTFDERDKYDNPCVSTVEDLHKYQFVISEFKKEGKTISPELSFLINDHHDVLDKRNKAWIIIPHAGIYTADVYYNNEIFSDHVIMLVLADAEMREVNKNIITSSWTLWYEAFLYTECGKKRTKSMNTALAINNHQPPDRRCSADTSPNRNQDARRKKVYCYITPKLLTVKEYYLKIFPKKLYTFRVNPTVKISLLNDEEKGTGFPSFQIETTTGQVVILYCQHRNVLVATFVKLLLKSIGGSEGFEDKKSYFYTELYKLHSSKSNTRASIKVKRENVIKDTLRAVKSFSQGDWWRKFDISFERELGLDYGGLTREWIHILIDKLFHTDGALFRRFNKDDHQALIHPNAFRYEEYQKVKLFELAGLIVGKCLVECACGTVRQQYIKARFTRSFLAQVLGLGVNWKHFQTDDKEYYSGKIKYILENDPEYLDIYFTEDVYDTDDKLVKTVELKPNGSKIEVTESNKVDYVQRLADYRLSECVKEEVASFLKGLHTIVPDGLLSIFDENELELLICGMDSISVSDLKANFIQAGSGKSFNQVMCWFWSVISGFSQEELSRLLQFTTGCSQLPPNGFAGLVPKFQITYSGGINTLPTAHTCFNNLCLPHYTNMEELKRKLLLAITEGSEGFGMV